MAATFPGGLDDKESAYNAGDLGSREDLLGNRMSTHSRFLPEEFHGQRSLEGYSPRGCKDLDTTE